MSARLADYGVSRKEPRWHQTALAKHSESGALQPVEWPKVAPALPSDSAGIDASISTQIGVLATFIRLIDDSDKRTLAATVSRIKELEQQAEAKLRFALNSNPSTTRVPKGPPWFEDVVRAELNGCLASAIFSTGQLLSALCEKLPLKQSEVDLKAGPDGIVIVTLGAACRWFVSPSRLPWPGCDVRLYMPDHADSLKLRVEHHRLVSNLIDSTVTFLNEDGR
jgi:hypothetical protein